MIAEGCNGWLDAFDENPVRQQESAGRKAYARAQV
jgi:hypothetical protein